VRELLAALIYWACLVVGAFAITRAPNIGILWLCTAPATILHAFGRTLLEPADGQRSLKAVLRLEVLAGVLTGCAWWLLLFSPAVLGPVADGGLVLLILAAMLVAFLSGLLVALSDQGISPGSRRRWTRRHIGSSVHPNGP
jgi:hypothetical protein